MSTPILAEACMWILLLWAWWFFYFPYRALCVDRTRQRLFDIRDELFAEALRRGIVDSPAHRHTRRTLNGMIRFTHRRTSLSTLAAFIVLSARGHEDDIAAYQEARRTALGAVPPTDRVIFESAMHEAHLMMTVHLFQTSALLFPAYVVAWLVAAAEKRSEVIQRSAVRRPRAVKRFQVVDAAAYGRGASETAPLLARAA